MAKMDSSRGNLVAVVLNGQIYACGGRRGPVELKSCERYDPAKNKWFTDVADMNIEPHWQDQGRLCLVEFNGRLIAFRNREAESYDPKLNEWSTLPANTTLDRDRASAVVIEIRVRDGS